MEHLVINVSEQTSERVPLTENEKAEREQLAAAAALENLRAERDVLLQASDWTQLPDAPQAGRQEWVAYRQKLRDLPAKTKDPAGVDWPEPPK